MNVWDEVLAHVRSTVDTEDFHRWFAPTVYARDVDSHVTVWVPTEAIRRHLATHFQGQIDRAFDAIGRNGTQVRFVVTGVGDEDDDEED